jgi:predicted DNA binding CopG/RHH family protein
MTPLDTETLHDARRASVAAKPAKIKRLTLDLSEELHRAIKINAAAEGVTMAEKLRALLMEHYGLNSSDRAE